MSRECPNPQKENARPRKDWSKIQCRNCGQCKLKPDFEQDVLLLPCNAFISKVTDNISRIDGHGQARCPQGENTGDYGATNNIGWDNVGDNAATSGDWDTSNNNGGETSGWDNNNKNDWETSGDAADTGNSNATNSWF